MGTTKTKSKNASKVIMVDRRTKPERRQNPVAVKSERRKTNRRRQIDPTTCERDYSHEEIEFMRAMDEYKRTSGRQFPTCSEVLEVIRALGYIRSSDHFGGGSTVSLADDTDGGESPVDVETL